MASQLTLFGDSTMNTKSTRRSYTREPKRCRGFGCGQFLPSLLSAYWVLSAYFLAVFGNKRMRLLTRVYGIYVSHVNMQCIPIMPTVRKYLRFTRSAIWPLEEKERDRYTVTLPFAPSTSRLSYTLIQGQCLLHLNHVDRSKYNPFIHVASTKAIGNLVLQKYYMFTCTSVPLFITMLKKIIVWSNELYAPDKHGNGVCQHKAKVHETKQCLPIGSI